MQILEIQLYTHRLTEQKSFYTEVLELPLVDDSNNSFSVRAGVSKISFIENEARDKPCYHFAFNIPENKLAEAKHWIRSRAPLIETEGRDEYTFAAWKAGAFYFHDAGGNIVEFIARHTLDNASDAPFNCCSLLNVSEIGTPVRDLHSFCSLLEQELGIAIYGGNKKDFAMYGDEHGLFIVVGVQRKWHPAGPPAKIFPLRITIKGDHEKTLKIAGLPYDIIVSGN